MIVHTIGLPGELMIERNMWKSRVIEPKDYYPKKLILEDMMHDGGVFMGYDISLLSGRRVKHDGLPTKVKWSDKRPVPDFEIIHAPTMIFSQRFRDVWRASSLACISSSQSNMSAKRVSMSPTCSTLSYVTGSTALITS